MKCKLCGLFSSDKCTPSCSNCDHHGRCIAPNLCRCYDGYSINGTGHCVPICSPECQNGYCVANNVCQCRSGYRKTSSDKHVCEPVCDLGCSQGKCIEPNVCECFPGYQARNDMPHECLPICDFCENEDCPVETDMMCTCWDSYEVQDFTHGEIAFLLTFLTLLHTK